MDDWSEAEKLQAEKELIGFYVSGHPLDRWRVDIESFSEARSSELDAMSGNGEETAGEDGVPLPPRRREDKYLRMVGMVSKVTRRPTQKGDMMAFVEMEDFTGSFEAIAFPRTYEKFGGLLSQDKPLIVWGKLDAKGRAPKILAEEFISPQAMREQKAKRLDIEIAAEGLDARRLEQLLATIKRHPRRPEVLAGVAVGGASRGGPTGPRQASEDRPHRQGPPRPRRVAPQAQDALLRSGGRASPSRRRRRARTGERRVR
jgi:DNA polymerase-3 subunit alpha